MLKKFLMNMLSSFVGAWLALVLVLMAGMILLFSIVGNVSMMSGGATEQLKARSILKLDLEGSITENEGAGSPDLMSVMQGDIERPMSLNIIVESIREAARNKSVAGLYLNCGMLSASTATLNAIREEIIEFRKSSKPVYAYADNYTMGSYFVASAADRVYLNPEGAVEMSGMSSTVPYYRDLLDKLGVKFQVVKVGTFKSAVEPYIMQEMSQPARAQLDTLLGNMWGYIKKGVSESRKGVTPALIDSMVSRKNITFQPATVPVQAGLVDSLAYGRTMKARFAAMTGQTPDDVNYVGPRTLVSRVPWSTAYGSKNRIAVLYAVGEINDYSSTGINFHKLVPVITQLADDDNVKGLVLRVNSPGGSAYGSAQIGEALDYFKSKGKPLAVSMGDYAASGGYWISAGSDIIFADPLTITGSIGIFGLVPDFSGTAAKLGVSMQTVSTNPGANFPNAFQPMDERQMGVMQSYVDRGYEQFVGRVAKGRHMTVPAVKRIAEGRVWDAISAKRIGLVDSLGGLNKAIEWTARKANILNKYNVAAYPEYEPTIWDMLPQGMTSMEAMRKLMQPRPEELLLARMRAILERERIQARIPDMSVQFGGSRRPVF